MAEREYLDYDDWLTAGGFEGTGQQLEPSNFYEQYVAPAPAAAPTTSTTTTPPPTTTSRGMSEQEGRAYDLAHGLVGGYMTPNGWVSGERPSGGGGGDIPDGGDGLATMTSSGPDYSTMLPYPDWQSAGPFTYEKFVPSTYDDLEKQPGFLDSQTRLRKQIEAGAAYRGMVRSGMTLGDLWTGLDTNKQQRFAEFDNRRFRDHTANFGFARDAYDRHATDVDRGNNYRFNVADASFKDAYNRWKTSVEAILAPPPE